MLRESSPLYARQDPKRRLIYQSTNLQKRPLVNNNPTKPQTPPKVLFVVSSLDVGGIETYLLRFLHYERFELNPIRPMPNGSALLRRIIARSVPSPLNSMSLVMSATSSERRVSKS